MNGWAALTIIVSVAIIGLAWCVVEAARAQSRERINAHNRGEHS